MIKIESSVYNHYEIGLKPTYALDFQDITIFHFKNNPEFNKNFLNQYLILYMFAGNFKLLIDDEIVLLNNKDIILIPPYRSIKSIPFSSESSESLSNETIFYTIEFSSNSLDNFNILQYTPIKNAESIEQYLMELYNEKKSTGENTCFCDAWLLLIIKLMNKLSYGNSAEQQLAQQIHTFISHNIMRPLTIADISSELSYNKDYLCRIFKKEYGISIKAFINKEKLTLAKRLLQTSDMHLSAISQLLGWDDVNLFIKFFTYHEKSSPTQYKSYSIIK